MFHVKPYERRHRVGQRLERVTVEEARSRLASTLAVLDEEQMRPEGLRSGQRIRDLKILAEAWRGVIDRLRADKAA